MKKIIVNGKKVEIDDRFVNSRLTKELLEDATFFSKELNCSIEKALIAIAVDRQRYMKEQNDDYYFIDFIVYEVNGKVYFKCYNEKEYHSSLVAALKGANADIETCLREIESRYQKIFND